MARPLRHLVNATCTQARHQSCNQIFIPTFSPNQKRFAATATVATPNAPIDDSSPTDIPSASTPVTSHQPAFDHKIRAAVLLSRPPLLTRDLTGFEKSFFFYQRRLNERLALPFTRYFYYQRGTPGDLEWKRKIRERLTASRDIGKFTGYSQDTWNDELLTGDKLSEPETQIEALILDAQDKEGASDSQSGSRKEDSIEKPVSRLTDADRKSDTRSLNRALSETLYLVVKGPQSRHGQEGWVLPESGLDTKEDLRTAAERIILQTGGINMNTWIIGTMPVAHQIFKPTKATVASGSVGEKTFYMKARMIAGQVNLDNNQFGLNDFQWVTQDEMRKSLRPRDFAAVKDILAER